ncbi:molybdopterin molybdotransferase MoeA [Corynebacterium pseudodiphtheriticum]|uniref:molybdopterin molybdotransferase MoeA n=1 Tax=Corynebacterium pseudodiphtheriticum TaxID=37637 RepID=UPI002549E6D1|nr:molybdopterin molybdotransferase MoeA [Corynebacterium pseudodiphtheriticum]MDK8551852.1 molybdopterin molybdotransferase MoeA [Corynebacterium pseudodiphtheriticum]
MSNCRQQAAGSTKPTPEEHLANITELIAQYGTWPSTETILVSDALDRYLVTAVPAPYDSPRFSNSQVDGYALSQAALDRLPGSFSVGADIPAGADPALKYPQGIDPDNSGETIVPIMTGAKIPAGVAAIVRVEDAVPPEFPEKIPSNGTNGTNTDASRGKPTAPRREISMAQQGQFIRQQGIDSRAGEIIVDSGEVLNPTAIAALALQGVSNVEVRKRARVLIATGGAEVAEIGELDAEAGSAVIPDANFPMLAAQAQRYGLEPVGRVHIDDDVDSLATSLQQAIDVHHPDLVVTSGGISKGKYEVVRQLLADGDGAWFGAVAQQPGGPQGYGSFAGVPCICLPGNPVSSLVSFRLFVAPAVGLVPEPIKVMSAEPLTGLSDKDQFLRARLEYSSGHVRARVVSGPGSHLLQQAVAADALVRVPAGATVNARQRLWAYPL